MSRTNNYPLPQCWTGVRQNPVRCAAGEDSCEAVAWDEKHGGSEARAFTKQVLTAIHKRSGWLPCLNH